MASNRSPASIRSNDRYADQLDLERDRPFDHEFETLIRSVLSRIGENPDREGLVRTPRRVAKALDFLTSGYGLSVDSVVKDALFTEDCREMVIIKDIEFYSLCEHHMLPFFGRAHVGYLPNGRVLGLSKIARVVDIFARRLQVQERMTSQIAEGLGAVLAAHGVAVVVEASHTCMMMRGVQKQSSVTITSAMRGTFETDARTRGEFMAFVRG